MHLWHRDGRVTKAEGNPSHPVNSGGLCPRGQSSLQGLYDPDRMRRVLHNQNGLKEERSWEEALEALGNTLRRAEGRVAVFSNLQTGALAEIMRAFSESFGSNRLLMYEPFNYEPLRDAHEAAFGNSSVPYYRLDNCEVVVSFAADFLESWISPVQFAHQYSRMRTDREGKMGRFAYVGPRLSMTAANADEFFQVSPGDERWVALAMLKTMLDRKWALREADKISSWIDSKEIDKNLPENISRDVIEKWTRLFVESKSSVALAGPVGASGAAARETALAAALLNFAAGRVGDTVDFSRLHALSQTATNGQVEAFFSSLSKDDVLIIHDANPVYSLNPASEHIRRAGTVIYLGLLMDETANMADWFLPLNSPLESWGDYEPYTGIHCLMQPTMQKLFDTRMAGDVFLDLGKAAGKPLTRDGSDSPAADFEQWLRQRWKQLGNRVSASQAFDSFWTEALRSGGVWEETSPVSLNLRSIDTTKNAPVAAAEHEVEEPSSMKLWVWPPIMLFDGRVANRTWLQESPEPISYITWGSWIDVHPEMAAALGIKNDDVVELKNQYGTVEAPVRVTAEVALATVAIPFGQGHTALGRNALKRGANPFKLLGAQNDQHPFPGVSIRKTGRQSKPVYGAATQKQHRRDILLWIPLSDFGELKPGNVEELDMPLPEGYKKSEDIYPPHEHRRHRWAMAVDLARCIGCGACAVACYAENNIAIMGAEQVQRGLEMAWLKVVPYRDEADPRRVGFLPMFCQHCDAAPCEPVCPVFAAVHNDEGLNAQVYNRCIGTRYCSNNCPYKVRRFNWFNHEWPEPLNLQLNPEVTVRSRGVMEKCTFCIQRIRQAEQRAYRENRPVRDGEILPACLQSCPTRVFIFGDLMDPQSEVTKIFRNHPRRYQVLKDLNTKPAVAYLKRIKIESNGELPSETHEGAS